MKRLFWGLFFLIGGGIIVTGSLGYLGEINLLSLIFTILLAAIIVGSIRHLHFGGILIPLAIIGILYAEPLGITELTPWPILATSVFISIGLTILFHKDYWQHGCKEHFNTVINTEDTDSIDMRVSFNSSIKYVNSEDFKLGHFSCSFGAMKIYFDNTKVSENGAEIQLDISFSGVELYIPKEWNVINNANVSLGGIDEKNRCIGKGPRVTITGNVSLSGVEIIYI